MVRIAIIGCGKIAVRHLEAYRGIENADVVELCDTNNELVGEVSRKYGVDGSTDYKKTIERDGIDAVDVCVPTRFHHEVVLEALAGGKNVFCEKPLTYRLEYAKEIQKKQKEIGKLVMVGYLYRFHPSLQRLKRILEDGVIGNPYYAILRIGGRGGYRAWKHKKNEAGGAMLDMMVHMLDLSDWYFGEPETVELVLVDTILRKRMIDGNLVDVNAEDFALLRLKTKNDVNVLCEADLITPSYMNLVEVHGDNGSFFGSILDYLPTIVYCVRRHGLFDRGKTVLENPYVNLVEKELRYFVDALSGRVKPLDSVETSIRVLKIIEEVRRRSM